jgi:hypothetical protein
MDIQCPRCHAMNRSIARFCARCGLSLSPGDGDVLEPGRIRHPKPVPPPDDFTPCEDADHLHYRWGAAWGGSFLLGTEGIAVLLFNGAYALKDVWLDIRGRHADGRELVALKQAVDTLPVGREVKIEIPSYELPDDPVQELTVALISAAFASEA